jgi:hypothetical protein
MKQTDEEKALPPVVGSLSMAEFQEMFKKENESTSSNPHSLNLEGNGKE